MNPPWSITWIAGSPIMAIAFSNSNSPKRVNGFFFSAVAFSIYTTLLLTPYFHGVILLFVLVFRHPFRSFFHCACRLLSEICVQRSIIVDKSAKNMTIKRTILCFDRISQLNFNTIIKNCGPYGKPLFFCLASKFQKTHNDISSITI